MKPLLTIASLLISLLCFSQYLEKTVISSFAGFLNSKNIQMDVVIGEVLTKQKKMNFIQVSEGFLQSNHSQVKSHKYKHKNSSINIYPNPTSNFIIIEGLVGINNITIINVFGSIISQTQVTGISQIDMTNYACGVYTINIIDAEGDIEAYQIIKVN